MQKNKLYNDGYLSAYQVKRKNNDFGAVVSSKTIDDMEFIVKLAYEERSKRMEDMEWADARYK